MNNGTTTTNNPLQRAVFLLLGVKQTSLIHSRNNRSTALHGHASVLALQGQMYHVKFKRKISLNLFSFSLRLTRSPLPQPFVQEYGFLKCKPALPHEILTQLQTPHSPTNQLQPFLSTLCLAHQPLLTISTGFLEKELS